MTCVTELLAYFLLRSVLNPNIIIKYKTYTLHNIFFYVLSKWNLNKTPKSWKGLLVKVQFQCKGVETLTKNETTEHCLVIKYTGTFTGTLWNVFFSFNLFVQVYSISKDPSNLLVNNCLTFSSFIVSKTEL